MLSNENRIVVLHIKKKNQWDELHSTDNRTMLQKPSMAAHPAKATATYSVASGISYIQTDFFLE